MLVFRARIHKKKQEGQVALNRSPEFCLKLTYSYLLKADHVPGDTLGGALWLQTRRFFQCFPYISLCKECDPVRGAFLATGT